VAGFSARSAGFALVLAASSLRAAPGFYLERVATRSGAVQGERSGTTRTWVSDEGARREDGRTVVLLDSASGTESHPDAKARTYFELSGDALAAALASSASEGRALLLRRTGSGSLAGPLQATGRQRQFGKWTASEYSLKQGGISATAWCAEGVVDPGWRDRLLQADAGLTEASMPASLIGLDALKALPGYPVKIEIDLSIADAKGSFGDELKIVEARDVPHEVLAVPAGWTRVDAPAVAPGVVAKAPAAPPAAPKPAVTQAAAPEVAAPEPVARPVERKPREPKHSKPKPAPPAAVPTPAAPTPVAPTPVAPTPAAPTPATPAPAPPKEAPIAREAEPQSPPATLVEAAHRGDLDAIRKLIAEGADIEKPEGPQNYRPLHAAARWGGAGAVTALLDAGAQRDARSGWDRTALHVAAAYGSLDAARVLIDRGASMAAEDLSLDTPLALAELVHQQAIAELLRSKGATVRARDISWAALNGDRVRIEELIKDGVDVSAPAERGQTPIVLAMSSGNEEIVPFLISKGAKVDVTMPEGGRQAIHFAAAWELRETFEQLVAAGAKKDARDENGATPLLVAARHASPEMIAWLIDQQRLDPRAETTRPAENALHLAARSGNIEVVKALLDRGMAAGAPSSDGTVALHSAAGGNSVAVVKLLLERDPGSLMAADDWGWTPLHQAARSGNLAIIRLLLSKGAKVDVLTKSEKTPASIALANDHRDAARLLVEEP
jgi:ankyrin repeat protein